MLRLTTERLALPILLFAAMLALPGCEKKSNGSGASSDPVGEDSSGLSEATTSSVDAGDPNPVADSSDPVAVQPLFVTTMTHMESNHEDHKFPWVFETHCDQLEWGMDLFGQYGAKLTVESEQPFARACVLWGRNMLAEVLSRGHGVGTHLDIGFREPLMPGADFAAMLLENKLLVDQLVGAENNRHGSGAGGVNDWVLGMQAAGFEFIDGIVSMHYLSMPIAERPDATWTDDYITNHAWHENAPPDLMDRVYLIEVVDARDFEADLGGGFTISNGELGRLDSLAEAALGMGYTLSNTFDTADAHALFDIIEQVDAQRDKTRVAKLNVYIPANQFDPIHEAAFRYLLEGLESYARQGLISFATQGEVFDAHRAAMAGSGF